MFSFDVDTIDVFSNPCIAFYDMTLLNHDLFFRNTLLICIISIDVSSYKSAYIKLVYNIINITQGVPYYVPFIRYPITSFQAM